MKKNKNSSDALLLAVVRIFTIATSLISTMLLSKTLSLESYGTYSVLNLIATSFATISVLGLADAMNYFYNREEKIHIQRNYVNTILAFQIFIGIITAIIIIISEPLLIKYFNNPLLKGMAIYIAFRPGLENMIISLQNLQVAIGNAKQIAIRNAIFSIIKVLTIIFCVVFLKDIRIILFMIVFMDLITVIYFYNTFSSKKYPVKLFKINYNILKKVLYFSIPMGIYVMTNNLMRELDKYVIGYFEPTSILAIYTNCSASLPLDIITNSFLVVIIPLITRLISSEDYVEAQKLFRNYLMIGIYSTIVFGVAIILVSKEAISLLYSEKYLLGNTVFILYVFVSMIRFANLTLVLSAKGKTKTLMKISIISLFVNIVLNIVLYKIFGFIGPAIATVLVTLVSTVSMCTISCKIIKISPLKILNKKEVSLFCFEIVIATIVFIFLKNYLYYIGLHKYIILFICAGGFSGLMLIINYKNIKEILKSV